MNKKIVMTILSLSVVVGLTTSALAATTNSPTKSITSVKCEYHTEKNESLQKLLGMSEAQIKKELSSGKTMAQLLDEKKITHVQLRNMRLQQRMLKIAGNTKMQQLLGMKEADILNALKSGKTISQLLDEKKVSFVQMEKMMPNKMKHTEGIVKNPQFQKLIGMTETEIQKELGSGKTLGQLLDEKKVTHVQLKEMKSQKYNHEQMFSQNKDLQKVLGMTQAQMEASFQSGKTLAQLLDEKGVTHVQMKKIKEKMFGEHGKKHHHKRQN